MDSKKRKLCSKVASSIAEKYGCESQIQDYPPDEQTVMLVISAVGILENGGFEYLFGLTPLGDPHYEKTLDAFRKIGASKASSVLESAFDLFPNGRPPENSRKRLQIYKRLSPGCREELDNKFYRTGDEITNCLARYIKMNKLDVKWR